MTTYFLDRHLQQLAYSNNPNSLFYVGFAITSVPVAESFGFLVGEPSIHSTL